MSWVRIHDGAMTHPKVVGLSDKAFRLWVWGLSYAQEHLTDGLLTAEAIPSRLKRASSDLTKKRLWEPHEVGFKVHDYLDWNDSRDVVLKKRKNAKDRYRRWDDAHQPSGASEQTRLRSSETTPSLSSETTLPARVGRESSGSFLEKGSGGKPPPEADIELRAGQLVQRYGELFVQYRHGAKYRPRPNLDWMDAQTLVPLWDDARLEKLAILVLTTDDPWIAGTDRSFKIFAMKASWADGKLREWEATHGVAV